MPIFILLSTLTQQGVQTLKSNPERLRQVNQDVEELGCRSSTSGRRSASSTSLTSSRHPTSRPSRRSRLRSARARSTKIETLPALEIEDFLPRSNSPTRDSCHSGARGVTIRPVRDPRDRRVRAAARRAVGRRAAGLAGADPGDPARPAAGRVRDRADRPPRRLSAPPARVRADRRPVRPRGSARGARVDGAAAGAHLAGARCGDLDLRAREHARRLRPLRRAAAAAASSR